MTLAKPKYYLEVFGVWRSAILHYHPNALVVGPNVLQSGYCKRIKVEFCRFFSEAEMPLFFDLCIGQFGSFCNWAKTNYCLFDFPMFPDLRYLSKHLTAFLNWYRVYKIEYSIRPKFRLLRGGHD